jgi:hypothetical protein
MTDLYIISIYDCYIVNSDIYFIYFYYHNKTHEWCKYFIWKLRVNCLHSSADSLAHHIRYDAV